MPDAVSDGKRAMISQIEFYCDTYRFYYMHGGAWPNSLNFGDILSRYIVEKITGHEMPVTDRKDSCKMVAIGSLIANETVHPGGVFWGTGMHVEKLDYATPMFPTVFHAVRGPLTRERLMNAGYQCPPIYGDPALLLPKFYKPKSGKKYKLGCIPHMIHADHLMCTEDVKKINIELMNNDNASIESTVDEINECEAIISSSLHGVIVANAYGIPARYMRVHSMPLSGIEGLKFSDYFQSVSMPDHKPIVISPRQTITKKYLDFISKTVDLKINLESLLGSFPRDLCFA